MCCLATLRFNGSTVSRETMRAVVVGNDKPLERIWTGQRSLKDQSVQTRSEISNFTCRRLNWPSDCQLLTFGLGSLEEQTEETAKDGWTQGSDVGRESNLRKGNDCLISNYLRLESISKKKLIRTSHSFNLFTRATVSLPGSVICWILTGLSKRAAVVGHRFLLQCFASRYTECHRNLLIN